MEISAGVEKFSSAEDLASSGVNITPSAEFVQLVKVMAIISTNGVNLKNIFAIANRGNMAISLSKAPGLSIQLPDVKS